jgi:GTP cyclohydrolase II
MKPFSFLHSSTNDSTESPVIEVDRALHELRTARCVRLEDGGSSLRMQAAEYAQTPLPENASLIVTLERLRYLGIEVNSSQVFLAKDLSLAQQQALIFGNARFDGAGGKPADPLQEQAIQLLKLAKLLPVVVCLPDSQHKGELRVAEGSIVVYARAVEEQVTRLAEAPLPIDAAGDARVQVFRGADGAEHLLLLFGQPETAKAPLVRVHSSCVTGDILGSLRCDCGDQLRTAIKTIAADGHGVLCYLNQEGRGIGIGNKIRAYALQDQGLDTLEANEALGYAADERHFVTAAALLKAIGISAVRLLTNNPAKVSALEEQGIEVVDRLPLAIQPHAHNEGYLQTKAKKFGHLF